MTQKRKEKKRKGYNEAKDQIIVGSHRGCTYIGDFFSYSFTSNSWKQPHTQHAKNKNKENKKKLYSIVLYMLNPICSSYEFLYLWCLLYNKTDVHLWLNTYEMFICDLMNQLVRNCTVNGSQSSVTVLVLEQRIPSRRAPQSIAQHLLLFLRCILETGNHIP